MNDILIKKCEFQNCGWQVKYKSYIGWVYIFVYLFDNDLPHQQLSSKQLFNMEKRTWHKVLAVLFIYNIFKNFAN